MALSKVLSTMCQYNSEKNHHLLLLKMLDDHIFQYLHLFAQREN